MRFSQREGIVPVNNVIQIDSMDDPLKTGLWNAYCLFYLNKIKTINRGVLYDETPIYVSQSNCRGHFRYLWLDLFKLPLNEFNDSCSIMKSYLSEVYFKYIWYEVYDFIEFVANLQDPSGNGNNEMFIAYCNQILERESSGYRFVGKTLTAITTPTELSAIEEALEESKKTNLTGVNLHIESALSKLSDRQNPDYRNSIKESISAVESIAQVISGDSNAELGNALNLIDKKIKLHGALKEGFKKIYGYTSNEDGIRHAMTSEANVEFEDAKYMLVACSAFVNYLIVKAQKAGII